MSVAIIGCLVVFISSISSAATAVWELLGELVGLKTVDGFGRPSGMGALETLVWLEGTHDSQGENWKELEYMEHWDSKEQMLSKLGTRGVPILQRPFMVLSVTQVNCLAHQVRIVLVKICQNSTCDGGCFQPNSGPTEMTKARTHTPSMASSALFSVTIVGYCSGQRTPM